MRLLTIVFFIFLFIFIRSLNFTEHLNFSFDQAWSSTRALEIWRDKEFTLVGPGNSIVVGGKQILQGSINYYFLLLFLILGNFDPIISSYLFMLFSAFMLVPLYYGVKMFYNHKTAVLIIAFYSLVPLYIDFTRFFFGPGFQFSLIPLLILFAGLYKQSKKLIYLFMAFFSIGVISQFHFATLIFFPLFLFYFIKKNYLKEKKSEEEGPPGSAELRVIGSEASTDGLAFVAVGTTTKEAKESSDRIWIKAVIIFSGFLLGFSPIIFFELKNKFYNIVVFSDYLKNAGSFSNFQLLPHRYLSLSLVLLVLIIGKYKKIVSVKLIVFACLILGIVDLSLYLPKPKQAFGMAENWNYLMEKKAYGIIKKEGLKDFNIANLIYDNLSVVIKYQMRKDNYLINFDDYYHNKYLFVIDKNEKNISKNPAYEVQNFNPRKKSKQWKINDSYNLYLYKRTK